MIKYEVYAVKFRLSYLPQIYGPSPKIMGQESREKDEDPRLQ